jgi:Stress responsive A/B Barrel Domain
MVLFRFRADVAPDQIDSVCDAIAADLATVDGLVSSAVGPNVLRIEGRDGGFSHGALMRFESAAARDRYLGSPGHAELGETVHAVLEDNVIFDIED